MTVGQFRVSRRSITITIAFAGLVSLAIGAHAALNKHVMDTVRVKTADAGASQMVPNSSRLALVIGNGHYPDAGKPLQQPINDARAITHALRQDGFDVDVIEDATHDDMVRAVARLKSKIKPDSTVMLYFGGFGVQAGRQSYMIPVDAAIWKERDVRRQGMSVEAVLNAVQESGAKAKLVVLDASRRNPYERRFRTYSRGLAPIDAPANALVLTSATPGKVADDADGQNSLLATELLKSLKSRPASAEAIFSETRAAVSRASDGDQVPVVSSSLVDDVKFGANAAGRAGS